MSGIVHAGKGRAVKSSPPKNRGNSRSDRARADNSRQDTKELLIEAAERLFGLRGIDGVSLREIAAEAGQANSNVVQYHFSNKEGLIKAILEDRVMRIEQVRCMQLAIIDGQSRPDVRQVLKVLWISLMSIRDADGTHLFCRFMLQYMLYPTPATTHPLAPFYDPDLLYGEGEHNRLPCGGRAAQLLLELYPEIPKPLLYQRISALARMFLASVVVHDQTRAAQAPGAAEKFDIEPLLDMAVAALGAPG